jgi:hypothetical protein
MNHIANCTERNSWETKSCSTCHIPFILWNQRIISMVTRTRQWALSWTRCKSLTFSKLISYQSWEFGFSWWWLWRILCSGMWCRLVWYKCAYVLKDRNCRKFLHTTWCYIIRQWSLQPTLILSCHLYLSLLSGFFSSGCNSFTPCNVM